ncbi:hypothetical protein QTP70_009432 [Hemibagrus guttatus]|uniref:Retrotransposon gag domain-containing protein n=1 Tax=Hemibagrus guttatus TaxID=175788 RepID=A0AAE0Q993_9TELE|nr:hypothetical protein QTP70_009432 [Hemibagrus guttatus]
MSCMMEIRGCQTPNSTMAKTKELSKDTRNKIVDLHQAGKTESAIGKGRELADVMERRKVDILCVQETRWKGSKARSIGAGFKLFYYGVDSKRNGVGVVLKEEFVRNVLEVKRVSDRVMSLKLEIEGVMLNVVSGYAPQVGCELEEKERFWSELDEVMESIPTSERVVIGADFNGHVGEGNTGDEEVMGKFGVKERNLEGQMVVDFAKRMDMGVVNTYFQKREEHRVTYKSGGRRTQKKKSEIEKKTKWWKLKKEECCEEFRKKLRQALGGQVVLPDDWETTAEVIRETGRKVLGVSSGRRKEDKETWWWNEEVQDSIQRKRLAKKKWDMDRTEENRQEYKELQRRVKREVSKAKQKAYDELYTRLDTREGEKDLYRLARQRDRDGKDVQQKVDKIRKDEVRKALKRMKSGKAVGPDDIPVEVWKCLGEAAVEFLASLFNRVLENLEKAYDRVPREELWYCMRKSGVAEKYVRVVQDMYERSRTVVRCAVVMDQLSEEVRQESPWTMMFADDIVICSESREQVEENLERWRFALERRGMKVSRIQSNGECGKEVKKRVQAETVSLRKRQESELEVAELKMLRFSLEVTRLDRIRNEYIRGTAHVGRLGDKVREARLRWFGHVQRRENEYIDTTASAQILTCLADISSWIMAHQLKLNPSKIELLAIPARRMDLASPGASGTPLQNTSPITDPAELREIIVQQGSLIRAFQDQLKALTIQLSNASAAASQETPIARGESPRLALPDKFDGSADRCRRFLRQCEVFFSHQPGMYRKDGTKCAFLHSLLMGRALEWASAVWDTDPLIQKSYPHFVEGIREVFEHPAGGKDISVQLMELCQGSEVAADYAIRFRTLAAQSEWNDTALWVVFRAGLNPALQMELACHVEATSLSQFVATAIRLDNLQCQHRARASDMATACPHVRMDYPGWAERDPEPMQLGRSSID